MSRLHRGSVIGALGLAILTFVVSLSLFPEWRQSLRVLISLAVAAVVGAVGFIAVWRQATEVHRPERPPIKPPEGDSSAPAFFVHHIPPPPSDFTGREAELKELLANFDKGATISGLRGQGGIGKTALARRLTAELAPQHPKVTGAIWAGLVNGAKELLGIHDESRGEGQTFFVEGLHRRYLRLTTDAPRLAGRAKPKFLRLVAPEAVRIEKRDEGFCALAWPGLLAGMALAVMLEQGTPYPIRAGWGDCLLAEAKARGYAVPLLAGGPVPEGYWIQPAPWGEIIADGIRRGEIALEDAALATPANVPELLAV